MIIDIHTHIYDEKTYEEYIKKSKGKISKIFTLHYPEENFRDLLKFVKTKKDLFFIGSIDVNKSIPKQIQTIEKLFKEKKIFGIKLYPGYQYFYPSDKKIISIAKLCQKYNKPLIFHSGDVYSTDGKAILKYAHPIHIDELAVKILGCKIIISHFGFPYQLETANIVYKNENVFTDISGTIDQCESKNEMKNLIKQYEKDLKRIFSYFPDIKKKVMFGTDYSGEDTPLNNIMPYIKIIKKIFNKKEQENSFYNLPKKIFLK